MNKVLAFLKREVALSAGVALSAIEASVASGSTLQVAAQAAAPLVLGALVRQLTSNPATKEAAMADLTALTQAVSDLSTAVTAVEAHVAQLKSDATPQAEVDAVVSQVQAVTQQVTAASIA